MRVIGAIALVVSLGGAAGCGAVPGVPTLPTGSMGSTGAPLGSTSRPTSDATVSRYSSKGADILFAQMTLLHHQQTVALAEMLSTKSGLRPEVRDMAQKLRGLEEPEIPTLRAWLAEWQAPESLNLHSGHPMKGILTEVELAGLDALDGVDFERQWLVRMVAHQDGAAVFAGSVVRQTQDERVRDMARRVIQTMPRQVVELQQLR